MITNTASKGFLSGRLGPVIAAVVVTGVLVFVACFLVWLLIGGGAWRSEVSVMESELRSPDTLTLVVASCHGAPRISLVRETNVEVEVEVVAFYTPFHGGLDCQDSVEVQLQEPLEGRRVVDNHTGEEVGVRTVR